MKNRIFLKAYALLLATTLLSCGNDKQPSNKEAAIEPSAKTVDESVAPSASQHSIGLHLTEQKLDAFMATYIGKIKAAFDEPDDVKSIAILQQLNVEMTPQGEALRAELEQWGKSLSETEKEAVKKRMEDKPYMSTLEELASNPNFYQRLAKSQQLRDAYDKASEGFEKLEVETK